MSPLCVEERPQVAVTMWLEVSARWSANVLFFLYTLLIVIMVFGARSWAIGTLPGVLPRAIKDMNETGKGVPAHPACSRRFSFLCWGGIAPLQPVCLLALKVVPS